MEDYLRIGVLKSPHGVKGEISVYPTSDDLERYRNLDQCFLLIGSEYKEVHVTGCKYKKNMPVLKFDEFNSIEEIEKYRETELYIDREHAIPLEEGEYYLVDVIGFDAFSDDKKIGKVTDYTTNEADQTIFIVECDDGETKYILNIPDFIESIDFENARININMIKGM